MKLKKITTILIFLACVLFLGAFGSELCGLTPPPPDAPDTGCGGGNSNAKDTQEQGANQAKV